MLFDVYAKYDMTPVKGEGCYVWDSSGKKYVDFYGGHGVISIGHDHPIWKSAIKDQMDKISFYSNSIQSPIQELVAEKLASASNYPTYSLFMVNSGAEANENALKLASFQTGRKKIISFKGGFHGRTSGTVAVSDFPGNISPYNDGHAVSFFTIGETDVFDEIEKGDTAAVIIEGIQGISGIVDPGNTFLQQLEEKCRQADTLLILDEVQSGFGRTGKFFAHQYAGVKADIVTMAKGMGNGFPVGGLLISPDIEARKGMLGTTFGGGHLACAATLAVLDVIEKENVLANTNAQGKVIAEHFQSGKGVLGVRGKGLMIGLEYPFDTTNLRKKLLDDGIIAGSSSNKNILRFLPPLIIGKDECQLLFDKMSKIITNDYETISLG
jgi:acetylornithine aminotransferase